MIILKFLLVSNLLLWNLVTSKPLLNIIHDLVQWNIAGVPTIHEKSNWDFDPEAGKQRQTEYEAYNGKMGERAIASIGLGYES